MARIPIAIMLVAVIALPHCGDDRLSPALRVPLPLPVDPGCASPPRYYRKIEDGCGPFGPSKFENGRPVGGKCSIDAITPDEETLCGQIIEMSCLVEKEKIELGEGFEFEWGWGTWDFDPDDLISRADGDYTCKVTYKVSA